MNSGEVLPNETGIEQSLRALNPLVSEVNDGSVWQLVVDLVLRFLVELPQFLFEICGYITHFFLDFPDDLLFCCFSQLYAVLSQHLQKVAIEVVSGE